MLGGRSAAPQCVTLPLIDLPEHAVNEQRRIADERIDRCSQFMRHAGEKLGLQPIGALYFLRLPLQTGVLFGQVGCRRPDPLLELAVECLERLVQPLDLDFLREIVQH